MLDTSGGGKGLRNLFEKLLSIQGALVIIALIAARYLFTFGSSLITDILQAILFLLAGSVMAATLGLTRSKHDLRRRPWQFMVTVMFLAGLIYYLLSEPPQGGIQNWNIGSVANVYLGFTALITVLGYLMYLAGKVSPSLFLPSSFFIVIVTGTLLLMSPKVTSGEGSIQPIDALFTSTSATCVTGLIVLDTENDFTPLGQLIILILIQVGGLGIMTFAAFFALTLGQKLGLSDTVNLSRLMDSEFSSELKHLLLSILFWTLAIESVGAFLLYNTWSAMDLGWSTSETVWQAVFHSISAFCNAGFSLNSTNLEAFSSSPATGYIIGTLIVMGGLGFGVLTGLGRNWILRMRTGRRTPPPVQVRLVLLVTLILIIAGVGFFLVFEWNNTLAGMPFSQKLGNAYLEAVSPRTAGFNTVPTAGLVPAVKWFFVILMFVGASPGGTGGGVKTTSIGLLVVSIRSLVQQRKQPEIWKRRIPIFDLQRAGAVLLLGMTAFGMSSILLLATENGQGGFTDMDYVFESMSAFGTVGLSTGVTPLLSTAGKWIIIVTMFIGRTAPATLAAATIRVRTSRYCYPEDRITIG